MCGQESARGQVRRREGEHKSLCVLRVLLRLWNVSFVFAPVRVTVGGAPAFTGMCL